MRDSPDLPKIKPDWEPKTAETNRTKDESK